MTNEHALAPLDRGELDTLAHCEAVIERGLQTFLEVGSALMTIKDARLYRNDYPSFQAYCQARWGFSRQRAYQLIDASALSDELSTRVDSLPENEAQFRALKRIAKERRGDVGRRVVAQHGTGATPRQIEQVALERGAQESTTVDSPTATPAPAPSTTDPTDCGQLDTNEALSQPVITHCTLPDEPPPFLQPEQDATPVTRLREHQTSGTAALQMRIAALEGERDQYKEHADKYFRETERLWGEIAKIDTELRDVRRERAAARAALEAERQRADGLENEADQLGNERNEALDERDALRQQLAQARATEATPWVPQTPDEALDADGLLVELVKVLGTEPTSLLALVKRLTTSREMLSHSLARCSHLWERLGLVLGDATPGTGGRGLWVPMEGVAGYTFGSIRREARADLHVPMADSHRQ